MAGGLFWIAGVDEALLLGFPGVGGGSAGGGLLGSDEIATPAAVGWFKLWIVGAAGADDEQQQ